jgi:SecD/SecF fusion protein
MKTKKLITFVSLLLLVCVLVYTAMFGLGSKDVGITSIEESMKLGLDIQGGVRLEYEAQTDLEGDALKRELDGTRAVMLTRIDSKGLMEPSLTINYDKKRILVEMPGVSDVSEAAAFIGTTAKLTFYKVAEAFVMDQEVYEAIDAGTLLVSDLDATEIMDGGSIKDASSRFLSIPGDYIGHVVDLSFNSNGRKVFEETTKEFVKRDNGFGHIAIAVDNKVISAPRAAQVITDDPYISGMSQEEAQNLALQIKSGALPLELKEVRSSLIGPTLGQDALESSVQAGLIGLILVILFMVIYYRVPGIIASVALILYTTIILFAMVGLQATLTLPGVLGIVLSLGMAVDANVVIFERLKEELKNGKTVRAAIKYGFKRAMKTIMDANITTLIAAVVLYSFGEGPIKGFATTLAIGIVVSILTAVFFTRTLLVLVDGLGLVKNKHAFGSLKDRPIKDIKLLNHFKVWFAVSGAIIAIGFGAFVINSGFNLGIDFQGGTSLQYDLNQSYEIDDVKTALEGVTVDGEALDAIYIKTGIGETKEEEIIIRTKQSLSADIRQDIENRLNEAFSNIDFRYVEQFSPSIGDEIKARAVIAILIAAVGMLIYITFRFELIFGLASIVALAHDVLILLAVYAVFRIPVNSAFIAAILTVVGYSINDTIVVFDRIRENVKFEKRPNYFELANRSLGQTIIRSINTSLTTLFVIGALYFLGVDSIKDLAFPLLAGILAGTYSSIFIASPTWALWRTYKSKKAKHYTEA